MITVNVDQSAGTENQLKIRYTIERECNGTGKDSAIEANFFDQTIQVDTLGPAITVPTASSITAFRNASRQILLPGVGSQPFGIGTTLNFTPSATDANAIQSFTMDGSAFGLGSNVALTNNQWINLTIPEGSVDSTTATLRFSATDQFGNKRPDAPTAAFSVDNTPPAQSFPNFRAQIERGPNAADTKVSFGWDLPAAPLQDTTWALVRMNGAPFGTLQRVTAAGMTAQAPISGVTDVFAQRFAFSLQPVDDAGNLHANPVNSTTAFPRVGNVSYGPTQSMAPIVPFDGLGRIEFTIDENAPASVGSNAFFLLKREGAGYLLTGRSGSQSGDFVPNPQATQIAHFTGATLVNGKVRFDNFVMPGGTQLQLLPGTYTLTLSVNGTQAGQSLRQSVQFIVDSNAPSLGTPTLWSGAGQPHGIDGNYVEVIASPSDNTVVGGANADTGLRNVTIQMVEAASPGQVARLANGQLASVDATPTSCAGFASCTSAQFGGPARLYFPGLPVGNYRVRILAWDNAGLLSHHTFDTNYQVVPRVGHDPATTPFYADGILTMAGVASHDRTPGQGDHCAGTLCQPTRVEFLIRNGADGNGVVARTLLPLPGKSVENAAIGNQTWNVYRYRESFGLSGTNVDVTQEMWVRVKAYYEIAGTPVPAETPWIRVSTPTTPALRVDFPVESAPTAAWFINTTGDVRVQIDFDAQATGTNPAFRLILNRTVPNQPVGSPLKGPPLVEPYYDDDTIIPPGSGPGYHLNETLDNLPNGEYHLRVIAIENGLVKATADRWFAVSRTDPKLLFSHAQPGGNLTVPSGTSLGGSAASFLVGRNFDLALVVDHGLLNLTSTENLTYMLTRASVGPGQSPVLAPGQEGFVVTVKNHSGFDAAKNRTYFNVTVTLPGDARDGDIFALDINATTDARSADDVPAQHRAAQNRWLALASAALRVDLGPPTGSVFRAATNATGDAAGGIRLKGFAEDVGSGVHSVEVRIVDLSREATLLWLPSGPVFVPGWATETTAFATSELVRNGTQPDHAKDVLFTQGAKGSTRVEWEIPVKGRLKYDANGNPLGGAYPDAPLDRNTVYEVNVRVRDMLGRVSVISNTTVLFDHLAPLIDPTPFPHGIRFNNGGLARVDWHGFPENALVEASVRDNNCVKRVSLRGFDPAGTPVGPADLKPSAQAVAACSPDAPAALKGAYHKWSVTMLDIPWMTDVVGRYRYYLEAEDAAGFVTTMPTDADSLLQVDVVDKHVPVVRYVNLEPPLVGVNATSRIVTEVFENNAIGRVEVHVSRLGSGGATTFLAKAIMRGDPTPAANGTGRYVATTHEDLNLTLEAGDYLVQVRANDTANTCTACAFTNAILRVSTDAPPAIVPGKSGGFVNATPVLVYEISDQHLEASGIRVEAGNSTQNLSAVPAAHVSALPQLSPGGARVGWTVRYAPGAIENGTLLVRVTATSKLTTVETYNYTVDADPPTVNHTVTGLRAVGGKEWVGPQTRVELVASDGMGSGIASVTYTVNGAPTRHAYTGLITPQGAEGAWTLEYEALDNASNAARGKVTLQIDRKGPGISFSRHGDEPVILVSEPSSASGLDEGNVTVHYAYNGSSTFTALKMERMAGTANAFTVKLPGNASSQGLRYWFEAKDRLGNVGHALDAQGRAYNATRPYEIAKDEGPVPENQAPTVRITAPAAGATVRDQAELKWTSLDPEGQPLKVTIGLITPSKPTGENLVIDGEDAQSYVLNTTGFPAGTYTFTLVASDGVKTSEVQKRSFVVEAVKTVSVVTPPPATVQPSAEARFAVGISPLGKTVREATFVVTRDGQTYATGTLTAEDGYYVGAVTPEEPGDYKVSVVVSYEEGGSDAPVEVASFTVAPLPASPSFPVSLVVLLAAAALTAALAAWGAFGRWR